VEREHNLSEMAGGPPWSQAKARTRRIWEARENALSAVARRPRNLRDDPRRQKGADGWREGITREWGEDGPETSVWRSFPETPKPYAAG